MGTELSISFGDNVTALTLSGTFRNMQRTSAVAGHVLNFIYSGATSSWWNASSQANTTGYTVAALNAAFPPASNIGMRAYVTDALGPVFLSPLSGSGALVCPAFCDGTHWVAA